MCWKNESGRRDGSLLALLALGLSCLASQPASAESVDRDAGCVGGMEPSTCAYHSDCSWSSRCVDGVCVCPAPSCASGAYREVCDEMGCMCEQRDSCEYTEECSEGMCYQRVCREDIETCESDPAQQTVCDEMGCRCARRPSCRAHTDCGDGVLCLRGWCRQADGVCGDFNLREVCRADGACACVQIEGSSCMDHAECGESYCVISRCLRGLDCEERRLEERCDGVGCRCVHGMDAGPPQPDASVFDGGREDGSIDGGSVDAGVTTNAGGCGCTVGAAAPLGGLYWMLGGLMLWTYRRRRFRPR